MFCLNLDIMPNIHNWSLGPITTRNDFSERLHVILLFRKLFSLNKASMVTHYIYSKAYHLNKTFSQKTGVSFISTRDSF